MNNLSLKDYGFQDFDKFFVGADRIFDSLSKTTKAFSSYPPYNIKKLGENKYAIEIAVAGFGKQDLEIDLNDGKLFIKGKVNQDNHPKDEKGNYYLYKGIADRAFTHIFSLSDTIEIKNAELFNGLLKIWLENIIPESKKTKKIEINSGSGILSEKEIAEWNQ